MKKIFIALAALSLTGCSFIDSVVSGAAPPPAPLASTAIDEKTLIVALQTFDTVLTAVDKLVAAGVIKPGSARAIQIADAIRSARLAFEAASAAQRAGSSSSYLAALGNAQTAIGKINLLIRG